MIQYAGLHFKVAVKIRYHFPKRMTENPILGIITKSVFSHLEGS